MISMDEYNRLLKRVGIMHTAQEYQTNLNRSVKSYIDQLGTEVKQLEGLILGLNAALGKAEEHIAQLEDRLDGVV